MWASLQRQHWQPCIQVFKINVCLKNLLSLNKDKFQSTLSINKIAWSNAEVFMQFKL